MSWDKKLILIMTPISTMIVSAILETFLFGSWGLTEVLAMGVFALTILSRFYPDE